MLRAPSAPSRAALAVLFALLAAAAAPGPAGAFCRTTTSFVQPDPTMCPPQAGIPIAWPSRCAGLSIDPDLLPDGLTRDEFRREVDRAIALWNRAACASGCPSFSFVTYPDCNQGGAWNPDGPNANTVLFRPVWDDDAFHPPDAIAVTITTFARETGAIRDTDTELNLRGPTNPMGFRFTTGAPDPTAADLPTILLHELGHAQGLAHSNVGGAVMWYAAGRGEQRRALTPDDTAGICEIYPPERTASCDPEPHGGFACPSAPCAENLDDAGTPCDAAPITYNRMCPRPGSCHCRATPAGRDASGGGGFAAVAMGAWWIARRRRRR